MEGIRGSLTVGNGINLRKREDVGYHFNVSAGFAVDPDFNNLRLPLALKVSRWAPELWQVGGETGFRFDFEKVNLDFLADMGAMIGGGDTGFAVAPTFKIGFWENLLGIEVSFIAYSQNDNIDQGTTYAGAYINLYNLGERIFGSTDSRSSRSETSRLAEELEVCAGLARQGYAYAADTCFEAIR